MGSLIKWFVFLLGLVGLGASKKRKEEVKKIDKKVKENKKQVKTSKKKVSTAKKASKKNSDSIKTWLKNMERMLTKAELLECLQ